MQTAYACLKVQMDLAQVTGALYVAESLATRHSAHKAAAHLLRKAERAMGEAGKAGLAVRGGKLRSESKGIQGRIGALAQDLDQEKPPRNLKKRFTAISAAVEGLVRSVRKTCGYAGSRRGSR